jgi:hypothetical protein
LLRCETCKVTPGGPVHPRHCLTDQVNARRYSTVIPSVSIAR